MRGDLRAVLGSGVLVVKGAEGDGCARVLKEAWSSGRCVLLGGRHTTRDRMDLSIALAVGQMHAFNFIVSVLELSSVEKSSWASEEAEGGTRDSGCGAEALAAQTARLLPTLNLIQVFSFLVIWRRCFGLFESHS